MAFIAELKRRRVFRAAAVYGATAFVILQAADLVFPRLGLPDWTVTLVVALALLGLPLTLALAWTFESSGDGLRRTPSAAPGELAAIVAQPRRQRWPIGIAALLGILLLAGGVWLVLDRKGSASYDSIAVLPFANLSGQAENEYFGDGLAEELLNALAGIEGLRVAARTSAFAFKGKNTDVRAIGDTLGVATVLEGSVRRSPTSIRITVQLIDTRSGFHIWSQTYDRPPSDLFEVQDEIASEIVSALTPRLSRAAKQDLFLGGTKDVLAYDQYLLGRQKWATRQVPLLREAIVHFDNAIARDSSFALAWSGLSDAIDALAYRAVDAQSLVPRARYAAQRAIVLEPQLAEAWASLGVISSDFDRDWRLAELALRRAIALKPGYATAYRWLGGVLNQSGHAATAEPFTRRAVELDPLSPMALLGLAQSLEQTGRWREAHSVHARIGPLSFLNQMIYARAYGLDPATVAGVAKQWAVVVEYGKVQEVEVVARAVLDSAHRREARAVIARMEVADVILRDLASASAAIGDYDRAMDLLERAIEQRVPLITIGMEPVFDPMRKDARFIRILSSLGLPNCDAACRTAGH